jgi:hypothetical protein
MKERIFHLFSEAKIVCRVPHATCNISSSIVSTIVGSVSPLSLPFIVSALEVEQKGVR